MPRFVFPLPQELFASRFLHILYNLCNWYFLSYPYFGTRSMTYLWFCFLSFLAGAFFLSQSKNFSAFCFVCIFSGVIASFYSFGEYLSFIPYYEPQHWPPRITGLFAHKNAFGFFIMNSSVWTAYLIFSGRLKKWNPLLVAALLIQLFALLTSDSRGMLVFTGAAFIGIFLPLFIKSGFFKKSKMRYLTYTVFFICMQMSGTNIFGCVLRI